MPGPCWQNRDGPTWSEEHQAIIREAAGVLTNLEVADRIGKSSEAVRRYAKRHGIILKPVRPRGRKPRARSVDSRWWPEERIEQLKRLWASGLSRASIAEEMDVSLPTVIGKLNRLGLKLSPEELTRRRLAAAALGKARQEEARAKKPPKPARVVSKSNPMASAPIYYVRPPKRKDTDRKVAVNDQELIAKFLAEKGATTCPKGWAYGSATPVYIGKSWRAA